MKNPIVLIIATLDTKEEEALYIRDTLVSEGARPILLNVGIFNANDDKADITMEQLARESDLDCKALQKKYDAGFAIAKMSEAVTKIVPAFCNKKEIHGIIGIGGGKGAAIASTAMRALPLSLPKVLVTSAAPGNARGFIGYSDIFIAFSPADMMGLNPVTKPILRNATKAVANMAQGYMEVKEVLLKYVAISSFGVTSPAVMRCKGMIQNAGFQVVVYPGSGLGGMAMEKAILEGNVIGVLDLTITELADELVGGIASAGPNRLEAAGKMGIPQVIVPGAVDIVNFGSPESIPERYSRRLFYRHSPNATLMRTNLEENAELGLITAAKLNVSLGPVAVVIPLKGFSAYDRTGAPWPDPEADFAYIEALKSRIVKDIEYIEVDDHINSEKFSTEIVNIFLKMMKDRQSQKNEN